MFYFSMKFKDKLKLGLTALAIGVSLASPVFAEEPKWNQYANMTYVDKYVSSYSGNLLNKNPSLQGVVGASREDGFNFYVWSDYTLGGNGSEPKFTEIDPSMNIPFPENDFVKGDFYAGAFIVPDGDVTGEIGLNLSPKHKLPVDVNLYFGQGVLNGENGRVVIPSVGKGICLTDKLGISLRVDAPWLDNYGGGDGFSQVAGSADLSYDIGDGWKIGGGVRHQIPLREGVEELTTGNISVSKSF